MVSQVAAWSFAVGDFSLTRYLQEIRQFPMLEPQEEYMLAKRWREHGDRDAAHKLVTSHLRLVAKIAMGYRGYGLPISELISEGNVGMMQAVKRFEPEQRLPPRHLRHVVDQGRDPGIHPALVVAGEDGHHRHAEEAVLQPAQGQEPDLGARGRRPAPDQVKIIAKRLGVTEEDVVDMNRRLGGDASLNAPIREDGDRRMAGLAGRRRRPTRRRGWRRARNPTIAARRSPRRCPCSTTASGTSSRRGG